MEGVWDLEPGETQPMSTDWWERVGRVVAFKGVSERLKMRGWMLSDSEREDISLDTWGESFVLV